MSTPSAAKIAYLVGADEGEALATVLARIGGAPAWRPFDDRAMDFVTALSRALLRDHGLRRFPELVALAHWFRPAALRELAAQHGATGAATVLRGRGLAFHVAPANVDSMAAYSALLSLLAGNPTVVRVSQKSSEQMDLFLRACRDILDGPSAPGMRDRLVVLTYPHDDAVTRAVSLACQLRVVWGGDATVAAIRAIALRPTAHELCFPDRFSAAALDAQAVLACSRDALARLVHDFCNDAFWFAQQACSSPRLVAWVGDSATCAQARAAFWPAVHAELARRGQDNTGGMAMDRLTAAFTLAARGEASMQSGAQWQDFPLRLRLDVALDEGVRQAHGGNGLFLEKDVPSLQALAPELGDKEQTLAVFGIPREQVLALLDAVGSRAIDRVVPVGQALAFSPVWDGHDLLASFTRRITIPAA